MSYKECTRFESFLKNGINTFARDFQVDLTLSLNTVNVSYGQTEGWQARPGVAPLPVHNQPFSLGGHDDGPFPLDGNSAANIHLRVYGCLQVTLSSESSTGFQGAKAPFYVWFLASKVDGTHSQYSYGFSSSRIDTNFDKREPSFESGIGRMNCPGPYVYLRMRYWRNYAASGVTDDPTLYQRVTGTKKYARTVAMSVPGKNISAKFLMCDVTTVPTGASIGVLDIHNYGCTSEFNYGPTDKTNHKVQINFITQGVNLNRTYNYSGIPVASYLLPQRNQAAQSAYADPGTPTSVTNRIDGATPALALVTQACVVDSQATMNTGYTAILSAPGTAIATIVQEQYTDLIHGYPGQDANLTLSNLFPAPQDTVNEAGGAYTEGTSVTNSVPVRTCWQSWPNFVAGTALAKSSASVRGAGISVRLGEAGSGILRASTVYEFAFSVFDKTTGSETNVGAPAKVQTGTDDFVAISLFRDQTGTTADAGTRLQEVPVSCGLFSMVSSQGTFANFVQFRVYYREIGTVEFLPACLIDGAQLLGDFSFNVLWACEGGIGALPAGQPGQFNDYSPLQNDTWFDVAVFQGRAFWCSEKQISFSNKGNVFAYAARNSVPAPVGSFLGCIPHAYPGEAVQDSRLVVFATEGAYIGRFKGADYAIQQAVTVSANATANFALDGSDFRLDTWTSITAFSGRSAVSAEGILYYWGPQGIYEDDGSQIPQKITDILEPYIFGLYDSTKTRDIFAYYIDQTKEVVFVYQATGATFSQALVFNRRDRKWTFWSFNGIIYWAQPLNVLTGAANLNAQGGLRVIAGVNSISSFNESAAFIDNQCSGGDVSTPIAIMIMKSTNPLGDNSVLFFANSGIPHIPNGTKISIVDSAKYYGVNVNDGIYSAVSSVDGVSVTLDGVISGFDNSPSGSGDITKYFPIYLDMTAGSAINVVEESNLWAPGGMRFWGLFLYGHLQSKVVLLPSTTAQTFTLEYRSNVSNQWLSNTITLSDNSNGNHQVVTSLNIFDYNTEGQAIKFRITRRHLGGVFSTQYLAFEVLPKDVENLRTFEG